MIKIKRYEIILQHEVIVYAPNTETAKTIALQAYNKSLCVLIREIPSIEEEVHGPIIDNRRAPGQ